MRRQDRRSLQQPSQVRGATPTDPGADAARCSRSSNGRSVPSAASIVIAATTSAARASRATRSAASMPDREHALRAVHEREPLLRLQRRAARVRPARAPARRLGPAVDEELARGRSAAARGSRAAPGRPTRRAIPARAPPGSDRGSASRPSARRLARTPECPSASTCARRSSIARASSRASGAPDRGGVRSHDPVLERRGLRRIDPHVGERAEPGRHPVDRVTGCDGIDDLRAARIRAAALAGKLTCAPPATATTSGCLERPADRDGHGRRFQQADVERRLDNVAVLAGLLPSERRRSDRTPVLRQPRCRRDAPRRGHRTRCRAAAHPRRRAGGTTDAARARSRSAGRSSPSRTRARRRAGRTAR